MDEEAERERLAKQLAKVDKELSDLEKRLSNEKFTSRAPAEVVAEKRARLERVAAQKAAIEEAIASLG